MCILVCENESLGISNLLQLASLSASLMHAFQIVSQKEDAVTHHRNKDMTSERKVGIGNLNIKKLIFLVIFKLALKRKSFMQELTKIPAANLVMSGKRQSQGARQAFEALSLSSKSPNPSSSFFPLPHRPSNTTIPHLIPRFCSICVQTNIHIYVG